VALNQLTGVSTPRNGNLAFLFGHLAADQHGFPEYATSHPLYVMINEIVPRGLPSAAHIWFGIGTWQFYSDVPGRNLAIHITANEPPWMVKRIGYALLHRARRADEFHGMDKRSIGTSTVATPARSTHVLHVPSSNVTLTTPASWRYYPSGGSGSREILYGFLSTTPFRQPCGTFTVQGREVETCKRPLRRLSPHGIVIELDGEIIPIYWNQLPASPHLHIAGHSARVGRVPITRKQLPWFCPLNTDKIMVGVVALSRRITFPGRFDIFSACLVGPDLTRLERQFIAMFRSIRLAASPA
jgi:hypothetical protein